MTFRLSMEFEQQHHHHLPSWIFDIVEEDQIDMQTPLLQELDIDVDYILRNIRWTLQSPWLFLFRFNQVLIERFPSLQQQSTPSSSSVISAHSIDFWGPCFIISLYGAILWFAKVNNVPWLYIIWIISASFHHLVCRIWYDKSSLLLHLSLLGYSITPVIPIAGIIVLIRKRLDQWLLIAILLQVLAVTLASTSAILSYSIVCSSSSNNTHYHPDASSNKITAADCNGDNTSGNSDRSHSSSPSGHKAKLSGKEEKSGNKSDTNSSETSDSKKSSSTSRLPLLVPLIILMHLYVISLIPMNN